MLFWLKKKVSALLLPLPLGLLCITLGLILLLSNRAYGTRITLLITGFLLIFIFSLPVTSSFLLSQLQSQYPPLLNPPKTVTQIVVLGGGLNGNRKYPPNITLTSSSLSRLVEGVRQYKEIKSEGGNPQLILSGGHTYLSSTEAGKMRNTAVMLGVPQSQTILENGSKDTREEAVYMKKILTQKPFILVTSAFHMPRSMALFEHVGLHPIAAPTEYLPTTSLRTINYVPSSYSLAESDTAIHEYLGIVWAWLWGHVS